MRIAVLLDLPPEARFHAATIDALRHAAARLDAPLDAVVVGTDSPRMRDELTRADGIVVGPGSPYRDEQAVWDGVRSARERDVPLVGT